MSDPFLCLGLESSCDDTAAAVLRVDAGHANILSNVVKGQDALHADFGGVVPEIAARAHAEMLEPVTRQALDDAGVALRDIGLISVTAGPGLIGGVMSGVMFAKGLATATGTPLIGVNHLAGHGLTPCLTDGVEFPFLMLLVSGGHCQFLIVKAPDSFQRLGGTIDDAPGEAFDKTARLLGLAQPGGPSVQKAAQNGNAARFPLPRPMLDKPGMDLSFSGLKTAVLRVKEDITRADNTIAQQDLNDLCASFQSAVADILVEKSRRALEEYLALTPSQPAFAVAGGVAANTQLRAALQNLCAAQDIQFCAPPLALCTDNAAMIAYAGAVQYLGGRRDGLDLSARPRWPLDTTQNAMLGSGKKGPKA